MNKKFKVLVVDDNYENIRVLVELLKDDYQLNATTNGFDAINYAVSWQPDLILLDVMMPEISGYNVCIQLKNEPETQNIPIIFVTALSDISDELLGLELGAIDYISKPLNTEIVKVRVKNHIQLKTYNDLIQSVINNKIEKLDEKESKYKLILENILNESGKYGFIGCFDKNHSYRCYEYTKIMVKKMILDMSVQELVTTDLSEAICCAALLHDIGKIIYNEDISVNIDEMSEEEIIKLKKHVILTTELINIINKKIDDKLLVSTTLDAIRYHHEHWDGTGNPDGIKEQEIPLVARIVAVANYYDICAGKTDYKDPSSHFDTLKKLTSKAGKNFDPDIVNLFLKNQDEFLEIVINTVSS